jgi:hypothetical protein
MLFFRLRAEKRIKDIVSNGQPFAPVTSSAQKKSVNKPEAESAAVIDEPEVVVKYIEVKADDEDDVWRCPCGRKGVVCYKYNKMYYDILKARRRFRR